MEEVYRAVTGFVDWIYEICGRKNRGYNGRDFEYLSEYESEKEFWEKEFEQENNFRE